MDFFYSRVYFYEFNSLARVGTRCFCDFGTKKAALECAYVYISREPFSKWHKISIKRNQGKIEFLFFPTSVKNDIRWSDDGVIISFGENELSAWLIHVGLETSGKIPTPTDENKFSKTHYRLDFKRFWISKEIFFYSIGSWIFMGLVMKIKIKFYGF